MTKILEGTVFKNQSRPRRGKTQLALLITRFQSNLL
jgi:hypothetical protein